MTPIKTSDFFIPFANGAENDILINIELGSHFTFTFVMGFQLPEFPFILHKYMLLGVYLIRNIFIYIEIHHSTRNDSRIMQSKERKCLIGYGVS